MIWVTCHFFIVCHESGPLELAELFESVAIEDISKHLTLVNNLVIANSYEVAIRADELTDVRAQLELLLRHDVTLIV